MTIPNNTPTRSAANAHEGQAAADTNLPKKYRAIFDQTLGTTGSVIIEAASPEEARQKAKDVSPDDVGNWETYRDEFGCERVELVDEGNRHD